MDEDLRRLERDAARGEPESAARLRAARQRGGDRVLPRWNPFTKVQCALSFECPKEWADMGHTEEPEVRFCDQCERPVHLVRSEAAFLDHAEAGRCVALPEGLPGLLVGANRDGSAVFHHPLSGVPGPTLTFLWGRLLCFLLLLAAGLYFAGAWLGFWPFDPRQLF